MLSNHGDNDRQGAEYYVDKTSKGKDRYVTAAGLVVAAEVAIVPGVAEEAEG
jgi:hypothetical protein